MSSRLKWPNRKAPAGLRRCFAAAAAASTLLAAPASAQMDRRSNPADLFAAFKAVCLDNFANSEAQIAAALAAPQDFEFRETGEDGTKRYWNERFSLSILGSADQRYCMVTAIVDDSVKIAEGSALLEPHLPATADKDPGDRDMVGWSDRRDGNNDSYFFVTRRGVATLASFAAGRDRPRARSSAPTTN